MSEVAGQKGLNLFGHIAIRGITHLDKGVSDPGPVARAVSPVKKRGHDWKAGSNGIDLYRPGRVMSMKRERTSKFRVRKRWTLNRLCGLC